MKTLCKADIPSALHWLNRGEVVAIPTETVYGLSANALDPYAVSRIFSIKNRPQFNPLILHIAHASLAEQWAEQIPTQAQQLMDQYWPGPLTIILKKKNVPNIVTSGLNTVALRNPDHPLTLQLLNQLTFPLAAPSANPFGYVSPTKPAHIYAQWAGKIPFILDGGPCRIGIESTIVDASQDNLVLCRQGAIPVEDIEKITGTLKKNTRKSRAPGQMKNHYAPKKKLVLGNLSELYDQYKTKNIGILSFQHKVNLPSAYQFILSPTGNLQEAAYQLFDFLHVLDTLDIDVILAERVPDVGLGKAINDRLQKAAH